MPSISVPPSFFISERNSVYANWRSAFWRELLSNSLDAGASRIRIRTAFRDDKLAVDVIDNGHGMTREVVEQVYMRLGASTKDGSDGIGGFGRARILTCFSQDSYSIRSSDFLVTGQGASYDIHPAAGPVRGCAVTVQMPQREARYLYASLQDVLRQSSLRAAIEIKLDMAAPEGVYLSPIDLRSFQQPDEAGWMRFRGWGRLGRHVETLSDASGPWADLHLNEGDRAISGRAIIRVNGMAMYEDHIGAPSQLTVNLVPGRAREVLTASRDAVRPPFRDVLQGLYDRIVSERITGFKARPREPVTELLTSETTRFRKGLPLPVREPAEIPIAAIQASLRADPPIHGHARPEMDPRPVRSLTCMPHRTSGPIRMGFSIRWPCMSAILGLSSGHRLRAMRLDPGSFPATRGGMPSFFSLPGLALVAMPWGFWRCSIAPSSILSIFGGSPASSSTGTCRRATCRSTTFPMAFF